MHAAILFLLDAESFEHLIQTINTDLSVLLDLDVARCLWNPTAVHCPMRNRPACGSWRKASPTIISKTETCACRGDITGDEALFGAGAGLVRSQALVRLNVSTGTPPCLLALGSREPDMFHAGMRTELISFLARVLERCIRSWLDLPA